MWVIHSTSHDVHDNLALEDYLLDQFNKDGPGILFYTNHDAVVIGKNQVPWLECDTGQLQRDNVPIGRRVSGGGTVFHCAGNLNYSILLSRTQYKQELVFGVVTDVLRQFDLVATLVNRTSLVVKEKKVSGNAFCIRKNAVLHHGTILLNANLKRLGTYLKPSLPQIETRGIRSVPMDVENLSAFNSSVTEGDVQSGLIDQCSRMCKSHAEERSVDLSLNSIQPYVEKHSSRSWIMEHSASFAVLFKNETDQLLLHVKRGTITGAEFDQKLQWLEGVTFHRGTMIEAAQACHSSAAQRVQNLLLSSAEF